MVPSTLRATVHANRLIILNKFIFSRHNSVPAAIQMPIGQQLPGLANKRAVCKVPSTASFPLFKSVKRETRRGIHVKACWFHRPLQSSTARRCAHSVTTLRPHCPLQHSPPPPSQHKHTASSSPHSAALNVPNARFHLLF